MAEKWFTDQVVETCEYCQCEIRPGNDILVSREGYLFDKHECIDRYAESGHEIDTTDIEIYTLFHQPNVKIRNDLLNPAIQKTKGLL